MAWSNLDIDKPHLAYMILGGFTGLFMLCSLVVKEKLYIGEATVATLCGVIFGPHAANLFDPMSWGNVDKITLECSRVVLVVQCFAVGVELPKAYMERHWKSVVLLLVPVMTWGWLITSLFIWWMVPPLNWLQGLICAACVTATDPVLASSVVGKGKFSKRVPRHLRDLISAESGCNDGMAYPFLYLSYYIIKYRPDSDKVALHFICVTILYMCVLGAIAGFTVGYCARHAIKWAEHRQLIDRESFLVFYFVLAVFCAGSGSLLGLDDLLMGFSAGVGFSNDGWFTEKTEESHVSNVIDLLLNLAYFVYLGSIIPWELYDAPDLGLVPWRLVVIAILVIFFRRLPIMLVLKPFIPDVKTWREALFAGHFGPIGVGAIFVSILARAQLETGSAQPLPRSKLPDPGDEQYYVIMLIWPITTFMVISSILVHGSSIAVFTLGKRINTLTVTLSYTTANEEGPSWMNRLPRVQSLAKGSMSFRKADETGEMSAEYPPGTLPPIGVPGNFLRRVRDEDSDTQSSMTSNMKPKSRRRRTPSIGGPVSQTAIAPQRRVDSDEDKAETEERDRIDREGSPASKERYRFGREPQLEVYHEGNQLIIEDEEGNVLKTEDISHETPESRDRCVQEQRRRLQQETSGDFAKSKSQQHGKTEGEMIQQKVGDKAGHPYTKARERISQWTGFGKPKPKEPEGKPVKGKPVEEEPKKPTMAKPRSAHAYQFGNTIIVEDEDGEVIKKYNIPETEDLEQAAPSGAAEGYVRRGLKRMGTWFGKEEQPESSQAAQKKAEEDDWLVDDGLRFTVAHDQDVSERGVKHRGSRMNKQEFIRQIKNLEPKARRDMVQESDAPGTVKHVADDQVHAADRQERRRSSVQAMDQAPPEIRKILPESDSEASEETEHDVPDVNVAASLARFSQGTSAEERRRHLRPTDSQSPPLLRRRDSEDDGTARVPPARLREAAGLRRPPQEADIEDTGETPAERRRRLAALGELQDADDSDSDEPEDSDSDNNGFRRVRGKVQFADGTKPAESREEAGGVSYRSDRGDEAEGSSNGNGNGNGNGSSSGSGSGSGNSRSGSRRRRRPKISWA
jgi:NhaP-type Na+/H+ or K+/H+ antiporter